MQIGRILGAQRVLGKSQGYYGLPIRDEAKNLGDLPHMLQFKSPWWVLVIRRSWSVWVKPSWMYAQPATVVAIKTRQKALRTVKSAKDRAGLSDDHR